MKAIWFGAALSTALLTGVCAHAQDAGVFEKWLSQEAPQCVPVSEFKSVSTVKDLSRPSSSSCARSMSRFRRSRGPFRPAITP